MVFGGLTLPPEALIGLLGVLFASLPQLTFQARLRNRVAFWANQVQAADLDYDRRVAESLRREATARLLAIEAYHAWRFLTPAYFVLVAFLLTSPAGLAYATGVEGLTGYLILALLVSPVLLTFSLVELAGVSRYRTRAINRYLRAEILYREGKLAGHGEIPRSERSDGKGMAFSRSHWLGAFLFSLPACWLSLVFFASLVAGEVIAPFGNLLGIVLPLVWSFAAASALVHGKFLRQEQQEWHFPRELADSAAIPAAQAMNNEPQPRHPWWRWW